MDDETFVSGQVRLASVGAVSYAGILSATVGCCAGGAVTPAVTQWRAAVPEAVARALLTSPVLLLLDEPTTGLDPKSKRQVQAFVREVRDTHDATVLLTSHDMDEVERVCDRIAVINKGEFVDVNTAGGLKKKLTNGGNLEDVFMTLTDDD